MKARLFTLAVVCFAGMLPSTPASALDDLQGWLQVITRKALGDTGLSAELELQPRYSDDQKTFNVNIVRPSLSYALTEEIALTAGYFLLLDEDVIERESRLWAQGSYRLKAEGVSLNTRLRFEERRWDETSESGTRLRFMPRLTFDNALAPFSPFVADEMFYEVDSVPGRSVGGLNQNRLYLGVNRKWSEQLATDLSVFYINQVRDLPQSDLNAFGALITLVHTW